MANVPTFPAYACMFCAGETRVESQRIVGGEMRRHRTCKRCGRYQFTKQPVSELTPKQRLPQPIIQRGE